MAILIQKQNWVQNWVQIKMLVKLEIVVNKINFRQTPNVGSGQNFGKNRNGFRSQKRLIYYTIKSTAYESPFGLFYRLDTFFPFFSPIKLYIRVKFFSR